MEVVGVNDLTQAVRLRKVRPRRKPPLGAAVARAALGRAWVAIMPFNKLNL